MPAGVPAIVPLANVTLGADASSVTFSNISQSYRDLILVSVNNPLNFNSQPGVRFNGDSANNYTNVIAAGDGASATSGAFGSSYAYLSNFSSNRASSVMHILDYSVTDKHKTVIASTAQMNTFVTMIAARWANTAAITSVTLMRSSSDSFLTGSSFALYGVSSV